MNSQSIGTLSQFTGSYRHDLLVDAFGADGRTPRELAKDADLSHQTVYDALEGELKKIDSLASMVTALKSRRPNLEIKHFFDFDLSRDEFRRTVLAGGQRAGR